MTVAEAQDLALETRLRTALARHNLAGVDLSRGATPTVTVVVPIQDRFDELTELLTSLALHTSEPAALVLADDASTDPRVHELLDQLAGRPHILVLRNSARAGRQSTVSRALFHCSGEAVILDPGTELSAGWLSRAPRVPRPELRLDRRGGGSPATGVLEGGPRRILFVVHEGGGGAVGVTGALMASLARERDVHCLRSDRRVLALERILPSGAEPVARWELERPVGLGDLTREDYRRVFATVLERAAPDLVHVGHLFKHTFDPLVLAGEAGMPVVLAFHDHYFICPTIHLLDERGRYCAGVCTPGPGVCPTVRGGSIPVLKHGFVHQWREDAQAAMRHVDAFVAPSQYTREIHLRFFEPARSRPFAVIPHGTDLPRSSEPAGRPPVPGRKVRILVAAHLDRHKGAPLLAAMSELDTDRRLDVHLLGSTPPHLAHLGTVHGRYEPAELPDRMARIAPAFVGVFTTTGESYSLALSEGWAAGIPALVTDLGAQAERVRSSGGGFVVSHDDPAQALAAILRAAEDPEAYARAAAAARAVSLPSVDEMAGGYAELYGAVLSARA